MNLQLRIDLLCRLGQYILSGDDPAAGEWIETKEKASLQNSWFTNEFITIAATNIATRFLQRNLLEQLALNYQIPEVHPHPKAVGIIMAGNIPLVGFHDFLCVFLSGNRLRIKASTKDEILIKHLVAKLQDWNPQTSEWVGFEEMLKGCDAYIATGSNNTSRYFEYYFSKYPHIIRRNRTSVAILQGNESAEELSRLADDVFLFFGRGCRNVTKLYVPPAYDFTALLASFDKYRYLADHFKYKNNYDYNLALHILNNKFYMTNGAILLSEDKSLFSPIGQLHYEFITHREKLLNELQSSDEVQCIVGNGFIPFGQAQQPALTDFADGTDTLKFLTSL
jgi:hypothetical protein